jgi:hypothetical protein
MRNIDALGEPIGDALRQFVAWMMLGAFYQAVVPSQRDVNLFEYVLRGGGIIRNGQVMPFHCHGADRRVYPNFQQHFDDIRTYLDPEYSDAPRLDALLKYI